MAQDSEDSEEELKPARTDEEILEEARERLKHCIDDSSEERKKQKDDLLFSTLEQWPANVKNDRETDPNGARPCLTIDQINQYIVQVVNDMRQNRPAVKVRPVDDEADIETAEIFQGIIRHIEDQSIAQIAYMTAGESAVRVGEGYFRFITEYEDEKSFNQVIRIKRVPDMFSVYLGPHIMPTGEDCEYGFVFEDVPEAKFRRLYPKAKYHQTDFDGMPDFKDYWFSQKKIRVAEYFYFEYQPVTLLFLADGTTVDAKTYDGPEKNIQDKRETRTRTTKWCKLTGIEILEKRDWAGKYIPIVKVTGKESWIDGKRVIWGLVRPAKDSLRMYNYVASTIVEKFALAPKAPFIGAVGQFATAGDRWKNANKVNYAYLEYDAIDVNGAVVNAPQRQQPAAIEAALYQFLATCREDVQASLGMFKASLGKEQPNQSGKAILALTRESDTGTFHFSDNLSLSIQYGGRILVDLSPKIMDTKQVIRVLGEDGKHQTANLNPDQPQSMTKNQTLDGSIQKIYNLGVGTYDVTATVGPSYNTKRMEASALFSDLATNAKDPHLALVANYFAIKNADFQGSEKAAEMLEKLMPPGLAPPPEGQPQIPPQVAQKMQEMGQAIQTLHGQLQEAESGVKQEQMKIDATSKESQAKIAAGHQEALAKIAADGQVAHAKGQLDNALKDKQLLIEREKAAEQRKLEQQKSADQIEQIRIQEEYARDTALRKAALEGAVKIEVARITATKDAAEGQTPAAGQDTNAIMGQILQTQVKLMEKISQPKHINLIKSNGQLTGAKIT